MVRWLLRALLLVVLVLAVGLPTAWLTRNGWLPAATQFAVNAWADRKGVDGPVITGLGFRLDDVSSSRVTLSGVEINGPDGFAAESIYVAFAWRDLLDGRIRSVSVDRPRLAVTVTEGGSVSLGRLEPLRGLTAGAAGGGDAPMPRIRFAEAEVRMGGAARGKVTASGTLGDSDGMIGLAADGSGTLEADDWRGDGHGKLFVTLGDGRTRINATLVEARVRRGDLSTEGLTGTASVEIGPDGIAAIADLAADRVDAAGLALAVPSAHLRIDPLSISAVLRLGDRSDPDVWLAVNADQAEGERRPMTVDMSAELETLDRLVAAARGEPARGLIGRLEGTLRGSMPATFDSADAVWRGAVAAGGIEMDATSDMVLAQLRMGVALAAGTLAMETLEAARLRVMAPTLPEPAVGALGDGPLAIVLGRRDKAFRVVLRNAFSDVELSVDGPATLAAAGGATLDFDGEAVVGGDPENPVVKSASGRVELRDVVLDGATVHEARLDLEALSASADAVEGLGVLTARLDAGDVSGLTASLPLRVVQDGNGTAIFLRRSGTVTVPEAPPAGGVRVEGPMTVRLDPARRAMIRRGYGDGDAIRLDVPITVTAVEAIADGATPFRISLAGARGTVKGRMVGSRGGAILRLASAGVTVAPLEATPEAPDGVAFADVTLDLTATTRGEDATLDRIVWSAARMSDLAQPVRFSALRTEGEATRASSGALEFISTFRGADGAFVLDAKGFHDIETGAGRAYVTLFPLVFVPGGLQPVALSPAAAALMRNASGRVSVDGAIEWPGTDVPPDEPLTLTVEDLAFTGTMGTVSGLTGAIALSSIDPITTLPGQKLSATGIDVGVPIAEPSVSFRLDRDFVLVLEQVRARFAGGRVTAADVRVPLQSGDPVSMVLDVDGVDAARLAQVTELDGLTATGSLSGRLPLVWDQVEGLSLRGARLAATMTGGTVRYRPDNPVPALQDAGEEVSLLMRAVRNLVYEQFEIEADGRPGEPFDIKLRVRGANPDLFDGYPVALNVSLSGRLDEMFLNARRTLGLSDVLRRKLEARNAGG